MIRLPVLLAGLVLAGASLAAGYAYRLEVATPAAQFAWRVALPAAVHRGVTRDDFADLRVVNAAGEPVPFGFASGGAEAVPAAERVTLPLFPVAREQAIAADFQLRVQRNADGSVLSVTSSEARPPSKSARTAFWLVDASRLERAVTGLRFEWPDLQGLSATARVEASDDLIHWRAFVSRASLIDLSFGGQRLRQDGFDFAPTRVRYLRLSIDAEGGPAPDIARVQAVLARAAGEPPRAQLEVTGRRVAGNATDIEFDLGGTWTVDRVEAGLPEVNTLAPVEILVRARPEDPWRPLARTVLYRIGSSTGAGGEVTSPPIPVAPTHARFWLLRADARSGGLGNGEVRLRVGYAERHVVFVARGAGPFRIEYGLRTPAGERPANGAALPLATLLPDYKPGKEWNLPQATTGPETVVNRNAVEKTLATEFDARKAVLWGLLLAAVLVLGIIAWRLLRDDGTSGGARP